MSEYLKAEINKALNQSKEVVYDMYDSVFVDGVAHEKQLEIIRKFLAPYKVRKDKLKKAAKDIILMAGRRSGKSYIVSCIMYHVLTVLKKDVVLVVPLLGTFEQALWIELQARALETHGFKPGVDIIYNINRKTVLFPKNKYGVLRLYPIEKRGNPDSLRGLGKGAGLFVVEEAGVYKNRLMKGLIEDAIDPIKAEDYRVRTIVLGTPPDAAKGKFVDMYNSPECLGYNFCCLDNPFLPDPKQFIKDYCIKNGYSDSSAKVQIEMYGKVVKDASILLYNFLDNERVENIDTNNGDWNFSAGLDIGHDDNSAIVVTAYNRYTGHVHTVYEAVSVNSLFTDIVKLVEDVCNLYPNIDIYADTQGGGSKVIVESLNNVQGKDYNMYPAEKKYRMSDMKLLNTLMRTGKYSVSPQCTDLIEDYLSVRWKVGVSRTKMADVDPAIPNDASDAKCYSLRGVFSLASKKVFEKKVIRTADEKEEDAIDEAMFERTDSKKFENF